MKKSLLFIAILFLAISCENQQVEHKSSPHVLKFYFGYHKNVPGIENIAFTVDSFNCTISNTDSIAYEANLTKLLPYIVFKGSPSKIQFNGQNWNRVDSLDFSQPTSLFLVSSNKKQEATYTITLNKHKVDPEEIIWVQQPDLTIEGTWLASKACTLNNQMYVFVQHSNNPQYGQLYIGADANSLQKTGSFLCNVNLSTIQAYNNKLYAISTDNTQLCVWNDTQWVETCNFATGTMTQLLGSLNGSLYIACMVNDTPCIAYYTGATITVDNTAVLPEQFALQGATPISTPNGLFLIGGIAHEEAQNCVISTHNGYYWTNILNQTGSYAFSPRYQSTAVYYQNMLFLFGGFAAPNVVTQEHYYSTNNGYSWNLQKDTQKLPDSYTYQAGTDAFVLQDNIYLVGPSNAQATSMSIWKGRIRKVDFKIK